MSKTSMWKRVMAALLAAVCLFAVFPDRVQAEDYWPEGPSIECPNAAVIEVNTGTVLYKKKANKVRYPASITKIMTALLAIENSEMDEIVVFSEDAVNKNEGDTSHIARDYREEMTMEQCLYAVMLESANECAYAVAEHVGAKLGGDYSTFIDLMNSRAKELGCKNTHFNNCNGLPDEDHWTSAYDMALIAAEAYRNETFRIITGTGSYTIPPTNKHKEPTYCHNHHKMIYPWQGDSRYLWDHCTGGKTGYTNAASNTLVTFAEKDGLSLVCVVMYVQAPNHYTDTRELLNYCFDNFQALNIAANEVSLVNESLENAGVMNDNEAFVTLDEDAYIVMPKALEFADAEFELDEVRDGSSTLAQLKYTYAKRIVGTAEIVTTGAKAPETYFEALEDQPPEETPRVIVIRPVFILLTLLLIVLVVLLIYSAKRLYDNYYYIRHRMEVRREQRERFRVKKTKKRYRRKDRMFR